LQQGHFAADIVYFYGEDTNLTALFDKTAPKSLQLWLRLHQLRWPDSRARRSRRPNRDAKRHELSRARPRFQQSSYVLPVLRASKVWWIRAPSWWAPTNRRPEPLRRCDRVRHVNDELFGVGVSTHMVGQGTVYAGQELGEVLKALGVSPDFDYTPSQTKTPLLFVHRKLTDGDLYFIDNRSSRTASALASFRVTGKAPELWHAEDGNVTRSRSKSLGSEPLYHSNSNPGERCSWSSVNSRGKPRARGPSRRRPYSPHSRATGR